MRPWNWLDPLLRDIQYALRMMGRAPAFTTVAVLSMGLGIGANTAIFSLMHMLLLRTLPVRDPGRLVEFLVHYPGDPPLNTFSFDSYQYFRDRSHVFSAVTGESASHYRLQGDGLEPETVDSECVLGNFFPALGLKPAIGRLIGPGDDHTSDTNSGVAVVSWAYWKKRYNLDPAILGKRIVVEEVPVTVVGVAPRDFIGLQLGAQPDLWVPLAVEWRIHPARRQGLGDMRLIARLAPGVTLEQARAEMAVLFRWTSDERTRVTKDSQMRRLTFSVEPAGSGLSSILRLEFAKPLAALMALVGLLLLIACTNVAGMLLARGAARQREMALRVSLGAGRFRLVRQVLTESLLLSLAGGLLGIFLAYFGASSLVRIMLSGRFVGGPPRIEIHLVPDPGILLFTGGIALLTGILFGLAPAWSAFTSAPASSLREVRSGETRFRRLFGKSLVAAQVAFTVVLLTAAGIFVRHLSDLEHLDLGFRRDHILLVGLNAAGSGYDGERLSRAYRELLARLEAIPGVHSATISAPTPLSGAGAPRLAKVEGHPERPEERRYTLLKWVAPRYFETLQTPLLRGRDFSFQDVGRPRVAIVNQAMASYYFPGVDPIGRYVSFDGDDKSYEIVGVAGDEKYYQIMEADRRIVYLNTFQEQRVASLFALRTEIDPASVAPQLRRVVRELLKTVELGKITTLTDQVDATIVPERIIATLAGWFGGLGALLAAIGLYGLLAYTVTRRINEIGIRMALGATRADVTLMVLRDALAMVAAGLAVGAPIAIRGRSLVAGAIQDLPARDGLTIGLAAAAMLLVALLAAWLPARRASRVEPVEALRHE